MDTRSACATSLLVLFYVAGCGSGEDTDLRRRAADRRAQPPAALAPEAEPRAESRTQSTHVDRRMNRYRGPDSGADAEDRSLEDLESPDAELRAHAVSALMPEDDELDRLIAVLARDPSPLVRAAAAEELGDADDPRAVDALIGALADGHREVVLEVIDALAWLEDSSAVPALVSLLGTTGDPELLDAAVEAIDWIAPE